MLLAHTISWGVYRYFGVGTGCVGYRLCLCLRVASINRGYTLSDGYYLHCGGVTASIILFASVRSSRIAFFSTTDSST